MFRLLCGEWLEPLWACSLVAGSGRCLPFLAVATFVCYLVLFSLVLALVGSTLSIADAEEDSDEDGENAMTVILDRFKALLCCFGRCKTQVC